MGRKEKAELCYKRGKRQSSLSTLVCFSKDTLKENKKSNPVRNWRGPRENISRRRRESDKSRRSPKALEVWKKSKIRGDGGVNRKSAT